MPELQENAGYTNGQGSPAEPSLAVDFEGASNVDVPPPNGEYDFTILRFTHKKSKSSDATYVDAQLQLDTEPARGRQVFDMLLTTYKDGSVVGTPQAAAAGRSQGNTARAIITTLGLPANLLRTMGPISDVIGKSLRGKFRAEMDDNDEPRLRLRKVVGPATGLPGVTAGAARPATESF